jgi:hypothetical protein
LVVMGIDCHRLRNKLNEVPPLILLRADEVIE